MPSFRMEIQNESVVPVSPTVN